MARNSFGICSLGKRIFVVGGLGFGWQVTASYQSYDILKDRWTHHDNQSVDYPLKVTLEPVKKRFIYCFGGRNSKFNLPARGTELICRLDSYRMGRGWESF